MALFNRTSETYDQAIASPSAFLGGTTNARGDEAGTSDPLTLFTITGVVAVKLFGVCTVDLTGASGTVAVGTVKNPTGLITTTTGTDIDIGEIWHDATPDASVELSSVATEKIVTKDIIETIATADITAGNIYYVCLWRALSPDGTVVPTNNA